jgi:hypothetical protein
MQLEPHQVSFFEAGRVQRVQIAELLTAKIGMAQENLKTQITRRNATGHGGETLSHEGHEGCHEGYEVERREAKAARAETRTGS